MSETLCLTQFSPHCVQLWLTPDRLSISLEDPRTQERFFTEIPRSYGTPKHEHDAIVDAIAQLVALLVGA